MNEEILDLGFLDVNIYSCISSQIDTDRVVITDKQLDHIADHHPEAYNDVLIELNETSQFFTKRNNSVNIYIQYKRYLRW